MLALDLLLFFQRAIIEVHQCYIFSIQRTPLTFHSNTPFQEYHQKTQVYRHLLPSLSLIRFSL